MIIRDTKHTPREYRGILLSEPVIRRDSLLLFCFFKYYFRRNIRILQECKYDELSQTHTHISSLHYFRLFSNRREWYFVRMYLYFFLLIINNLSFARSYVYYWCDIAYHPFTILCVTWFCGYEKRIVISITPCIFRDRRFSPSFSIFWKEFERNATDTFPFCFCLLPWSSYFIFFYWFENSIWN